MPVVNFMPEFADLVATGEKTQTIRRKRERPISVGNTVFLYTGTRTKQCRKLGVGVCTSVKPIIISRSELSSSFMGYILLDDNLLTFEEENELAKRDGFEDFDKFVAFFKDRYGLPFEGVLIEWELKVEDK